MTFDVPLFYTQSVVLDENGYGSIVGVGPAFQGSRWRIERLTTNINAQSSDPPAELRVFRGAISDTTIIEGTYSGNFDISDSVILLQHNESLSFEWRFGPPNLAAVVRIEGTYTQAGNFVSARG